MNLLGVLPFARFLLQNVLTPGSIAVDGTTGNGHDTVFLAKLVGETGHVYGFDVQDQAIHQTNKRVKELGFPERVTLFHASHEQVATLIPPDQHPNIKAAIFNLGYLPGSDKTIVTKPESTITAIKKLLSIMPSGALIVLVIYHGHEEGKIEKTALESFVTDLDQTTVHVLRYEFINQVNDPPFIIAIEKR
ncbi:class I SAM-dependent methyltransferase [Halalkalibacterium halodurans]|jgi:tRNA A58 N-methylase Trm61|uniref:rRNA methyltransferase n=1 Tax=Halalkalibacterium halodurans TaxID=86665 RepID=A0A0M0KHX4_ALKHA|nr:class I SAM-dependent methyltransferase [Halalkalibacterium halodurans]MED3646839.1 class I SAM-dependent methyltransferase [Halalkalibacterium halodurans]MED4163141.1 class I SAM-dependent methyltransferase [Halalkalibacterium halodurans]TES54392.1 methyltransferase domain-containing protein [Halalkalibacterium halodurans]TPE68603.1 methyltransferase domain-containing protein [Halalkalibacterium halodurans]